MSELTVCSNTPRREKSLEATNCKNWDEEHRGHVREGIQGYFLTIFVINAIQFRFFMNRLLGSQVESLHCLKARQLTTTLSQKKHFSFALMWPISQLKYDQLQYLSIISKNLVTLVTLKPKFQPH